MKIVIDIPEEEYRRVADGKWYGNGLADYIENGTQLPKGYGRLIDADALDFESPDFDTYNDYSFMFDMIDNAPTIIEADKEGEQE